VDNNINKLAKLNVENLCEFNGIGPAKAISIITALELGKRQRLEEALVAPKLNSSKAVFNIMHPILEDLSHEEFWVIYLDNSNRILKKTALSKGGITGTLIDVRLLFKMAVELTAVGIILCHNHPSNKLNPSNEDRKITEKIKKAGAILDIQVLDHLIVTKTAYYSFADEGEL
jgi:DNA repair protein RadC